jgi:hypothetical protein
MRAGKLIGTMFLLVFVLGLAYGGLNLAGAAGPPSVVSGAVTVANTPSNPVPVTGTVTVGGTSTVQLNPSTVVQTSAADNPAFQPFEATLDTDTVVGNDFMRTNSVAVPAGKELVIQSASFLLAAPLGASVAEAFLDAGVQNWFAIGHTDASLASALTQGTWQGSIYVPSGTLVDCAVVASSLTSGSPDLHCTINGYLVNLP